MRERRMLGHHGGALVRAGKSRLPRFAHGPREPVTDPFSPPLSAPRARVACHIHPFRPVHAQACEIALEERGRCV